MMADALAADGVDAVILGVNGVGYESGNDTVTDGRDTPWLQDTEAWDAWGRWDVEYRDVIVLDPQNVPVAVFNLTERDLADPAAQAELRCLIEAAGG